MRSATLEGTSTHMVLLRDNQIICTFVYIGRKCESQASKTSYVRNLVMSVQKIENVSRFDMGVLNLCF